MNSYSYSDKEYKRGRNTLLLSVGLVFLVVFLALVPGARSAVANGASNLVQAAKELVAREDQLGKLEASLNEVYTQLDPLFPGLIDPNPCTGENRTIECLIDWWLNDLAEYQFMVNRDYPVRLAELAECREENKRCKADLALCHEQLAACLLNCFGGNGGNGNGNGGNGGVATSVVVVNPTPFIVRPTVIYDDDSGGYVPGASRSYAEGGTGQGGNAEIGDVSASARQSQEIAPITVNVPISVTIGTGSERYERIEIREYYHVYEYVVVAVVINNGTMQYFVPCDLILMYPCLILYLPTYLWVDCPIIPACPVCPGCPPTPTPGATWTPGGPTATPTRTPYWVYPSATPTLIEPHWPTPTWTPGGPTATDDPNPTATGVSPTATDVPNPTSTDYPNPTATGVSPTATNVPPTVQPTAVVVLDEHDNCKWQVEEGPQRIYLHPDYGFTIKFPFDGQPIAVFNGNELSMTVLGATVWYKPWYAGGSYCPFTGEVADAIKVVPSVLTQSGRPDGHPPVWWRNTTCDLLEKEDDFGQKDRPNYPTFNGNINCPSWGRRILGSEVDCFALSPSSMASLIGGRPQDWTFIGFTPWRSHLAWVFKAEDGQLSNLRHPGWGDFDFWDQARFPSPWRADIPQAGHATFNCK